ncbi:UBC-like protein [Wallemia mellicola]|nr:UBC-like protein [Wallemia mellicola]
MVRQLESIFTTIVNVDKASPAARKRLMKELATMQLEGCPPYTYARPEESNILIWHFVFLGNEDTPYQDGEYHGVLEFPKDYPFSPPHIKFHTPSGRFKPNTSICTSFSDFHKDTWNPMLSVSTILTSLLSFFNEDAVGTGGMTTSDEERRRLARESKAFNRDRSRNVKFSKVFDELLHPTDGQKSLDEVLADSIKQKVVIPKKPTDDDNTKTKTEPSSKSNPDTKGVEKSLNNLTIKDNADPKTKESSSNIDSSNKLATSDTPATGVKPPAKKGSAMSRFRAKVKNNATD